MLSSAEKSALQISNCWNYDIRWATKNLPIKVQQKISCHLEAEHLEKFISIHLGIMTLKEKFDDHWFQKFLCHFFRELEKDNLKLFTKKALKKHYNNFRMSLLSEWIIDSEHGNLTAVNITTLDWATRSLGFEAALPQTLPKPTKEEEFFKIKFGDKPGFERFPIPIVPDCLSNIVPSVPNYNCHNNFFEQLPFGNKQRDFYLLPLDESTDSKDQFFLRLSSMIVCMENNAIHEAFAYGAELLGRKDFSRNAYLQKCFFHVWGNLAVCFAKLNRNLFYIFSCLAQMDQLAEFYSEKLDAAHYRQQVCAIIGWYQEETKMFQFIQDSIPRTSMFFRMSLHLHLQSVIQHIEDLTMHIYVCKEIQQQDLFEDSVWKVNQQIQKCRRLLHALFSHSDICKHKCSTTFRYFAILDVMEVLLNKLVDLDPVTSFQRNKILQNAGNSLFGYEHHIDFFLKHYNFQTNFRDFQSDIDIFKETVEEDSHCANPIIWASVLFTHVMLIKIFDENNTSAAYFAQESKHLYEKINHPRAKLLHDFLHCKFLADKTFHMTVPTGESMPHVDIVCLLKSDSLVKNLVRIGIESLKRFDSFEISV